jgi:hypothetical protein
MKMGPSLTEIRRKPVLTLDRNLLLLLPLLTPLPPLECCFDTHASNVE